MTDVIQADHVEAALSGQKFCAFGQHWTDNEGFEMSTIRDLGISKVDERTICIKCFRTFVP